MAYVEDVPEKAKPTQTESLRARAVRGSVWTIVGYGASQALRLGGNLILTRLLFPEAFGVAALVSIFMQGLEMFSDVGIGPSIIRSPRGEDPTFLDTAWTIQASRGLMLWAGSALIAWPAAAFYRVPQLAWLIPVAGLGAALQGFNSTALPLCSRRLLLGRLVILDLGVQAVGLAATAYLAWMYRSVWALVLGGLLGLCVKLVLGHLVLADRPNRPRWDASAARELFGFGKWIFLSTLITFLAGQADRIALGKIATLSQLGLYTMALSLAQIPRAIFQRLSDAVVYPLLSSLVHRPGGDVRIVAIRKMLLVASALPCAAMLVLARPVVGLLFDPRYAEAGDYLGVLMIGSWYQGIQNSYRPVILAKGAPEYMAGGYALRLILFAALAWPAHRWYGVPGIVALSVLSELGVVASCTYGAARLGVASISADATANAAFAAAILTFEAIYRVSFRTGGGHSTAIWGVIGAATSTILASLIILAGRTLARREISPQ